MQGQDGSLVAPAWGFRHHPKLHMGGRKPAGENHGRMGSHLPSSHTRIAHPPPKSSEGTKPPCGRVLVGASMDQGRESEIEKKRRASPPPYIGTIHFMVRNVEHIQSTPRTIPGPGRGRATHYGRWLQSVVARSPHMLYPWVNRGADGPPSREDEHTFQRTYTGCITASRAPHYAVTSAS